MLHLHNDFLFGVALFQAYSDADGNGLLNLTSCGEHYPNRRVCRYNRAGCNDPIFIIIYVEIYCVGYGNAVPFASMYISISLPIKDCAYSLSSVFITTVPEYRVPSSV